MLIRLNKYIAQSGICSRRKADDLIMNGKIKVNDIITNKLGRKIDSQIDKVTLNGKIITPINEKIYYALNKPVGYTSSNLDKFAKHIITDLVPANPKVNPVGRLDKNSCGLMILTNDNDLINILTHPRYKHEKEYEVTIKKLNSSQITPDNVKRYFLKLKKGIPLEEGIARIDDCKLVKISQDEKVAVFDLILHQGWKRQIRRMFEKIKLNVIKLKRIRIAKLKLDDLSLGKYKIINKKNIL